MKNTNFFKLAIKNDELVKFAMGEDTYFIQDREYDEHSVVGSWNTYVLPYFKNNKNDCIKNVRLMFSQLSKADQISICVKVEKLLYHLYVYYYFKSKGDINFSIDDIEEVILIEIEKCRKNIQFANDTAKLNGLITSVQAVKNKGGLLGYSLEIVKLDYEAFYKAVYKNDVNSATKMIEKGIDVNKKNEFGKAALHEVVMNGQLNMVKLLLESKADIDVLDDQSYTPIHYAISGSRPEILEILISQGASLSFKDSYGNNLISIAVNGYREDDSIIKILLKNKVDPTIPNYYGNDTLGQLEMPKNEKIRVLFSKWGNFQTYQKNEYDKLRVAISKNDIDTVSELIRQGIDINECTQFGNTALHSAMRDDRLDIVKLLIDSGADINMLDTEGYSSLYLSVSRTLPEILEELIKSDASLNFKGPDDYSLIKTAIMRYQGDDRIIKILINSKAVQVLVNQKIKKEIIKLLKKAKNKNIKPLFAQWLD
ncbi:ankyrin repeat domain-containing protein [Aquimarina sp. 2304DJ70-9]|uniref:ankyrin repeat domain-containing protein n=1 Tax=Aquimarina penaris TaxID=3231044 RepID=UPI0034629E89